MSGVQ
jgi:hypothetical protein